MYGDNYLVHYLAHYGIPGMKWGRRKSKSSKTTRRAKIKSIRKDRKKAAKNRMLLSDKELESRISRIQKEKKLKDLTSESLNPGRKKAKEIISDSGTGALKTITKGSMVYGVKAALTKSFSFKEAAAYVAPKPKK